MDPFAQLSLAITIAHTSVSGYLEVNNGTVCVVPLSRTLKEPCHVHRRFLIQTLNVEVSMPNSHLQQHLLAVYVQRGGM